MAGSRTPRAPRPWERILTLVGVLMLGLYSWFGTQALAHDDDVLAFLPPDHPDVVAFRDVADRFGMLEVALIGLRADGEDLLTTERTEEIRALAKSVTEADGVRLVLSYPELPDARVVGQTLVVEPLVPKSVTGAPEIRRRVLGNFNAVGNFISDDGNSAMLMVYMLGSDAEPGARGRVLEGLRDIVDSQWSGEAYFGGAPYVEHAAASASRSDIERLSPIVIAVLVIASSLLLRSLVGAVLNLVITGLGVGIVLGTLGFIGLPLSIVSSTMPVMMVALGGAFGMHMIAGYQRQSGTPPERAAATYRELVLPVLLSGITTAASFLALSVMPQAPMRVFGYVAAFAMWVLILLAVGLIPLLLSMLPRTWLPTKSEATLGLRWRPPTWALALVGVGAAALVGTLTADPDTRNVFDEDSDVALADRFLSDNFGGSQFVQIGIEADLSEPTVLRKIRTIVEALRGREGIADVRSLLEPVVLLTEGFGGRAGIPTTQQRARRIISNLASQDVMIQLMTSNPEAAVIHVKLAPGDSASQIETTDWIRKTVADVSVDAIHVVSTADLKIAQARQAHVQARVAALVGHPVSDEAFASLLDGADDPGLRTDLSLLRKRAFGTDEVVEPLPADEYEALSIASITKLRGEALEAAIKTAMPTLVADDPEGVKYAAQQLGQWADEAVEQRRVRGMCESLGLSVEGAATSEPAGDVEPGSPSDVAPRGPAEPSPPDDAEPDPAPPKAPDDAKADPEADAAMDALFGGPGGGGADEVAAPTKAKTDVTMRSVFGEPSPGGEPRPNSDKPGDKNPAAAEVSLDSVFGDAPSATKEPEHSDEEKEVLDSVFGGPSKAAPAAGGSTAAAAAAAPSDDPVAAEPFVPTGQCAELLAVVSELEDAEWARPEGVDAPPLRSVPVHTWVTGQPLIGQAFAQSVTESLMWSIVASVVGLFVVLLVFGKIRSLVPALWSLLITGGAIAVLDHPISIGTSMVACIALGAGIDFAIHLGVRARESEGDAPGQQAVEAIGGVVLITGVQLAAAFLVLLASEMPPLRQFGSGLAIGLLSAAAGAVWLIPVLYRRR